MANAVDFDEALVVAARRQSAGGDGERGDQAVAARMADADTPGRAVGLRAEDRKVSGEVHAGARDARLVQHGRGAIDRVLLPETAEIELHSAARKTDVAGIALDAPPVDESEERRERLRVGHPGDIEAPRAAKDSRSGIEGAAALPVAGIGEIEEARCLGVDRHGLAPRVRVDARDDTVVPVARILRLDPRDFGDRLPGRRLRGPGIFCMELYLVLGRHGAKREAMQRHAQAQNARLTPAMP